MAGCIAIVCITSVSAQPGVSLSLDAGYSKGSGAVLGSSYISNGSTFTERQIVGSYASGFPVRLGAQFWFTSHLALYCYFNWFCGVPVLIDEYQTSNDMGQATIKAMTLGFAPGLLLQTASEGRLDIYSQAGFLIPFMGSYETNSSGNFGSNTWEQTTRTTLRPGLGCDFEVGVDLALGDRLELSAGLRGTAMSLWRNQTEITAYTANGIDLLPNTPESQRMVNYQMELNENSNIPSNPDFDQDQPGDALNRLDPFGAWGLRIGANLRL